MKKHIMELAPLFAALHVYAALASLFGLGQLGSWMIKYWASTTRAFWDFFMQKILFLDFDIKNNDKDALTAVVFFVPLMVADLSKLVKEGLERVDLVAEKGRR